MANLFLTGTGTPTGATGETSDYYRDLATNLIYYYNTGGWEAVPSLIPTPDGVGTNWLFGTGAPDSGVGSTNDYYRDDANGSIYRKHATNGWEAKGSLDFIGVYGVQWGEGSGAPISTPALDGLPAGSFYLDVATSDIYYKDNTLTWSLKGQLGGSGGGGGGSVTVVDNLTSTSTTSALSANQGKVLQESKAPLDSPTLTGTPTAPTPATNDSSTQIATTEMVQLATSGAAGDAITTASEDATSKANTAEANAKAYADTLVVGLIDNRGNYDPTVTSNYPTWDNNGSGTEGAILKGDMWTISADGTMGGIAVTVGDAVRALVNAPAQTASNWAIIQNNISYVPENVTNKSTDVNLGTSDTLYPTQKAVKDYVTANALTIANSRYQFVTDANTTYTVPASAVTANGNTIIELSNNSLTNITVNAATATGKTAGDSVTIHMTGTYAAQLLVADGVTLNGTLAFSANAKIKTLIYRGSNTWTVLGG